MEGVSLVIPVYNEEKFVAKAIESCLDQTVKPKEIIVIDDGSTDKTPDIVRDFMYRYDKIVYIRNSKNMGIGYSRWRGVKDASGDYIAFCSADDALCPNFIEVMLEYSKKYPDSILYSDYYICDENLKVIGTFKAPEFRSYEDFVIRVISEAKRHTMFVCYNIFSPSNILKKYNFDPEKRFGEDLEHLLRCVLVHKVKFAHVPVPLFYYRTHPMTTTSRRIKDIPANNLKTFEKINRLLGRKVL